VLSWNLLGTRFRTLSNRKPPYPAGAGAARERAGRVDKAPEILREDAEKFLERCQRKHRPAQEKATSLVEAPPIPHPQVSPPICSSVHYISIAVVCSPAIFSRTNFGKGRCDCAVRISHSLCRQLSSR
jgi:hypothetical protein